MIIYNIYIYRYIISIYYINIIDNIILSIISKSSYIQVGQKTQWDSFQLYIWGFSFMLAHMTFDDWMAEIMRALYMDIKTTLNQKH